VDLQTEYEEVLLIRLLVKVVYRSLKRDVEFLCVVCQVVNLPFPLDRPDIFPRLFVVYPPVFSDKDEVDGEQGQLCENEENRRAVKPVNELNRAVNHTILLRTGRSNSIK
jgi:hypothetical protein